MSKLKSPKIILFIVILIGIAALAGLSTRFQYYAKEKWNHGIKFKKLQVKLFPENPRFLDGLANSLRKEESFTCTYPMAAVYIILLWYLQKGHFNRYLRSQLSFSHSVWMK